MPIFTLNFEKILSKKKKCEWLCVLHIWCFLTECNHINLTTLDVTEVSKYIAFWGHCASKVNVGVLYL